MDKKEIAARRAYLRKENRKFSKHFVLIPWNEWPSSVEGLPVKPVEAWRSSEFFVQVFHEAEGIERLTINRTEMDRNGNWQDGITWDELQWIKGELGYGSSTAVEIFPPEEAVVNAANMRHLWVLNEPLPFMWGKEKCGGKSNG